MMYLYYGILNLIGIALLAYALLGFKRTYLKLQSGKDRLKLLQPWLSGLGVIGGSLLISFLFFKEPTEVPDSTRIVLTVLTAFGISAVWARYIIRLDVFEKERKRHLALVFLGACVSTLLVFPLSDWYIQLTGHTLNGNPFSDFWYCVIAIGLIEEIVKILPVLLLLRFTRVINEPFDYLLYSSIAALGFAFIENILYLDSYEHFVTNARALYASVAHMTFSSAVGYTMMLFRYKHKRKQWQGLLLGLGIASLAHGFYDFWLINQWASTYSVITMLFFLATVHLWTILKNNALNISPYFEPTTELRNDRIKGYLAMGLLSIAMFAYLVTALRYGWPSAVRFLIKEFYVYGYVILYLVVGLSNYDLVRAYLSPLKIPFRLLLLPGMDVRKNHNGLELRLSDAPRITNNAERDILLGGSISGTLKEKLVVRLQPDWYLMELSRPLGKPGYLDHFIAVSEREESPPLDNPPGTLVRVMLIRSATAVDGSEVQKAYEFAGFYKAVPVSVGKG